MLLLGSKKMAEYEVLQHAFPEGVALLIMRFLSHPAADLLKAKIDQWRYYRMVAKWLRPSEGRRLEFVDYWHNARTLTEAREQYLHHLTRTATRWKDYMYDFDEGMPLFWDHMTRIPIAHEDNADDEVESLHSEDIEEIIEDE